MGGGWIERLTYHIPWQIQHKFKKMTKLLKINERLTLIVVEDFYDYEVERDQRRYELNKGVVRSFIVEDGNVLSSNR